ncbi:MAG TPA: ABC transporter permease [Candidatus Polarisedimenticolia bacterium]|nr:ABC transporter permease [Candidatus Polarisedimenticolia bacterium]
MEQFLQDLKYGARMLRKRPGFTVVAVLTLALGIGANTAIFSSVNAILLQPLPLPERDRLVLFSDTTGEGTSQGSPRDGVWERYSMASYRHFVKSVPAFEDLAAFRSGESRLNVIGEKDGATESLLASGHLVSGNYFRLLGVDAEMGRALTPDDDRDGAPPAAVVSHAWWTAHGAGDRSTVGRTVTVNGLPLTIVGVMPERFFGLRIRRAPDFWIPLAFQPRIERTDSFLTNRDVYWLNMVGRLKPGTTLQEASAQANTALKQYLRSEGGTTPADDWKDAIERGAVRLAPGGSGISGLRVYYGQPLKVLMVVAGFVLLIACANLTNLLLSRATERRGEIAMRLALGAGRGRLIRQVMTESLMLAVLGGAAGLLLALWGVEALRSLVSKSAPIDVGLNLPVLGFTAAVSILAGVLFGLAPALRAGKADLITAMRARGEGGGAGRLRTGLAPVLVVTQVALSLVLLAGSGLLVRSLMNLAGADVGFQRDGVVIVDIDTRVAGLAPHELGDYYRRLIERIAAIPAVTSATVATYSPMSGSTRNNSLTIEGRTAAPGEDVSSDTILVAPGFASTLRIPIVRGRVVEERDGPAAPKVAFVNEAFARAYFPGTDPIGRRVAIGDEPENPRYEIVGVVGDARYENPREPASRTMFLALLQAQDQSAYSSDLEVRTSGDPMTAVPEIRRAVSEVDARVPIATVTSLRQQVTSSVGPEMLLAQLVSTFSLLALVLASVGLYGVVSQAVARRTNEMGIRMALGADRRRILGMVLREAGLLILVGLALGIPGAALAARVLTTQLYGVTPADPATLALSAAVLLAVALLAGYIPARRASRVDPLVALRAE